MTERVLTYALMWIAGIMFTAAGTLLYGTMSATNGLSVELSKLSVKGEMIEKTLADVGARFNSIHSEISGFKMASSIISQMSVEVDRCKERLDAVERKK